MIRLHGRVKVTRTLDPAGSHVVVLRADLMRGPGKIAPTFESKGKPTP
jgi:hypothetical protein